MVYSFILYNIDLVCIYTFKWG